MKLKKSPKVVKNAASRRDGAGHIEPRYAAELLARAKESAMAPDGDAFRRPGQREDTLAEPAAQEFLTGATGGDDAVEEAQQEVVEEEFGGPFVESTSDVEFAGGTDASNPEGATREPFPKT